MLFWNAFPFDGVDARRSFVYLLSSVRRERRRIQGRYYKLFFQSVDYKLYTFG